MYTFSFKLLKNIMGYHSDFFIITKPAVKNLSLSKFYKEILSDEDFLTDDKGKCTIYDRKWYCCNDEVRELSLIYKDVLFIVKRYGQDLGDREIIFTKNGYQYVERVRTKKIKPMDIFVETKLYTEILK